MSDASPTAVTAALSYADKFYMEVEMSMTSVTRSINPSISDQLVSAYHSYAQNRYDRMRLFLGEGKTADALIICRPFLESSIRSWNILLSEPTEQQELEEDHSKYLFPAQWRRDRKVCEGILPHVSSLKDSSAKSLFSALLAIATAASAEITKTEARALNNRYSFKQQLEQLRQRSERVQSGLDFSALDYLHSLASHMLHADTIGLIYESEPAIGIAAEHTCSIIGAALSVWYYHVLFTTYYHGWDYAAASRLYEDLQSSRALFEPV